MWEFLCLYKPFNFELLLHILLYLLDIPSPTGEGAIQFPLPAVDWKALLKEQWTYIKKNMNAHKIYDDLWSNSVICEEVTSKIKATPSKVEANRLVLEFIYDSDTFETFKTFISVLRDSSAEVPVHREVAEKLDSIWVAKEQDSNVSFIILCIQQIRPYYKCNNY